MLEETLARLGVADLIVCGMMMQNCVTHAAISMTAAKYNVSVLVECRATVNVIPRAIALHALSTRLKLVRPSEAISQI